MKRSQFHTALSIVDKHFETRSPEFWDKVLTKEEHAQICEEALKEVLVVFHNETDEILLNPYISPAPKGDFAGYTLDCPNDTGGSHRTSVEFEYETYGITVEH